MPKITGHEKPLIYTCPDIGESDESTEIAAALGAEIAAQFAAPDTAPLTICARNGGALVGGLSGASHWSWLYVRHLWVAEGSRGRGVGRELLLRAEAQARTRKCVGVYIDTFDAGAVVFYEKCGFARFGQLEDFPPGSTRTFLRKRL